MVINGGMNTPGVVEELNILENALLRLFPRFIAVQVDQFLLEYAMKRLDAGIVIAIALATHAPDHFIEN
ncbi:hypothetical protein D3C72_2425780 [compost metagenome]